MKDFYQILGVPRGSTDAEIKKAYRRLAKQYHPDVNKGDKAAEEKFKEISEAYNVLSDPKQRKQYDMFGGAGFAMKPFWYPVDGTHYRVAGHAYVARCDAAIDYAGLKNILEVLTVLPG